MRNFWLLTLNAISFVSIAQGAQRIWISDKSTPGTWHLEDPVCLYQANQLSGCGLIKEMKTGSFAVDVFDQRQPIQPRVPVKVVKDVRTAATSAGLKNSMNVSNAKNINLA